MKKHQEQFEQHDKKFKVLTLTPNFTDFKPVKHLGDVLDHVRTMEAPSGKLQDLKDLLFTSLCQISQHTHKPLHKH